MNNNDILRSLRYSLELSNAKMVNLFGLSQREIGQADLMNLLAKDDDPNFVECGDTDLALFLDGLILDRRGPREPGAPPPKTAERLTNNEILRKIRIALELKEDDMLEMLKLGGMEMSRPELSALFRKVDHKHYKAAGGQLLRNFLKGLTVKNRYPGSRPGA